MYFRALHAIMTGRYRLSTRKFIFDLFDFQLDCGLVKQLNAVAGVLVMDEEDVYKREEEELLGRRERRVTRYSMTPRLASGGGESDVEVDVLKGVFGSG